MNPAIAAMPSHMEHGCLYAGGEISKDVPVPADAPPMFVAAANDDPLGLAPESVALYERWAGAHKSAELHLYAKGGHGGLVRSKCA